MRTLLLNASGEFLGVTDWQSAIGDVVVGNVHVLESYDKTISSQHLELKVPAVVKEISYVNAKFDKIFGVSYGKKNVFIRDHYECQYCGYKCSRESYSNKELARKPSLLKILPTVDHVIPSSKGGASTWENSVTACRRCNGQKDDRMLSDTGLKLKSIPRKPTGFKEILEMKVGQIHDLWIQYLRIYF